MQFLFSWGILFARYPTLISVRVVVDHNTGQSQGYGFARFASMEEVRNSQHNAHD
jgi:RNA recognition motif-containing protein